MAHSAIVIPVAELEPVVRPMMRRSLPAFMFADADAIHAHVTVLGPFVHVDDVDTGLIRALDDLFAAAEPFAFTVDGAPHTLPDGTVCLEPEPAAAFGALTRLVWQAFPDYPPYGSPTMEPRPHITLEYPWAPTAGRPAVDVADLGCDFPVRAVATVAHLNWYEPRASRTIRRFVLGDGERSVVR